MFPDRFDHKVAAGEDYHFDVTFKDGDVIVNLTGFDIVCKVLNVLQRVAAVAEVEVQDPATGIATFKFSRAQTATLRGLYHCSVKAVGSTGYTQYAISGEFRVYQGEELPEAIPGDVLGALPAISGALQNE